MTCEICTYYFLLFHLDFQGTKYFFLLENSVWVHSVKWKFLYSNEVQLLKYFTLLLLQSYTRNNVWNQVWHKTEIINQIINSEDPQWSAAGVDNRQKHTALVVENMIRNTMTPKAASESLFCSWVEDDLNYLFSPCTWPVLAHVDKKT